MIGGRVLDLSAVHAFAAQTSIYASALVWTAVEEDVVLLVPSTVVGLAWAAVDPRSHPVLEVLLDLPVTVIDELTGTRSRDVGQVLLDSRVRIDQAHCVFCARQRGWPLVTAEPESYDGLGDMLVIEALP